MMCEVCSGVGHSGNDCPKTHGATAYINNRFSQQGGQNGWNHQSRPQHRGGNSNFNSIYNWNEPSLKDLVLSQAKTIETLKEKLKINDKMLKLMNFKIEGLTSSTNNQLSFNKRIETQLAQSATIPVDDLGEILGQPKTSLESVKMVSTRFGKPLCRESQDHLIESPSVTKKEDPSRLTITWSIGPHVIHNAFYDLGASINIMSKVTYDEILGGPLSTTNFQLQMADQSLRKPEGVAKDVLVKI
jgi:hypothetical protein